MGAICAMSEDRQQVLPPTLEAQAEGVSKSSNWDAGRAFGRFPMPEGSG
ncbi:hypothetical protein CSE45_0087 [Citreicella sp. SE45]|nr:hypothetical protein CSE45_0087 [Citreicella sp. SE45]